MRRTKKDSIDHAVADDYVGLAKEAAQKPLPRADVDIEYFLDLAEKSGEHITSKAREEVWDLFTKAHGERIKRVEGVIAKYKSEKDEHARNQLAWYEQELRRLKEWKGPKH